MFFICTFSWCSALVFLFTAFFLCVLVLVHWQIDHKKHFQQRHIWFMSRMGSWYWFFFSPLEKKTKENKTICLHYFPSLAMQWHISDQLLSQITQRALCILKSLFAIQLLSCFYRGEGTRGGTGSDNVWGEGNFRKRKHSLGSLYGGCNSSWSQKSQKWNKNKKQIKG